ncbi:MAG: NeuD/PglB/VioB family sugar acetyltransferase [Melioribacteraceae bacterium]|nr:NeuD/PglB/VioB family sugar acetyltransferase [Melioribacteraceae bacterium]
MTLIKSLEMSVNLKRMFDFSISLFVLVLFSPIIFITAILIRVKIGAPVLFKQKRPGLHEKLFYVYKFRSMTNERDANGLLLPDDVRLTGFGKLLRKLSLDELPQLWNVLKGDMSFVGPRPLLIEYLPLYNQLQARRHDIRPGITGWAQVNGRNTISWNQKFNYDIWYVENQSLWIDIKILLMTVLKVFMFEGINQQGDVPMTKFQGNLLSISKSNAGMKIVIIGDSGHAKVIADCVHSNSMDSVIAVLDDLYEEPFDENGIQKGPINMVYDLLKQKDVRIIVAIGSNKIRKKIVEKLDLSNESYGIIVHESAIVSPSASIDVGTVVMPLVVINADATIGKHAILNSKSVVEHNCLVSDYTHISPGAVLTGGVKVGVGTQIGAGSSVIPLMEIGGWSLVGAGSVVISNLESNIIAVGVPAKIIKREGLQIAERIYLSSPHMSGNEKKYINEAFETNWIAPLGPNVDQFEQEIAAYVGIKGAAAVSSGTAAIHLALKLLEVGSGDFVFCSSLTFIASAYPIKYANATPVFIDAEPDTWNMSPNALDRAFQDAKSKGQIPKAVIVVNLYGQSAKMDELMEICRRYQVPMIEDAAESLGSSYKGKKSGTFGDYGIYSFNGNKIITTSGGGMLVSNDEKVLNYARFLSTQARDAALHYQHSVIGYNYRMSNVLAGIGRAQLEVLDERVAARRAVYNRYVDALGEIDGVDFMKELEGTFSNRWLTALTLDPETIAVKSYDLINALAKENIEARPVWKPLHMQPVFEGCAFYTHGEKDVISERLFARGLCLPSGSNLTFEQQGKVIKILKETLIGVKNEN